MFLSKKNARYFNKPKNSDPNKPKRILPGKNFDIQVGSRKKSRGNRNTSSHQLQLRSNTSLRIF